MLILLAGLQSQPMDIIEAAGWTAPARSRVPLHHAAAHAAVHRAVLAARHDLIVQTFDAVFTITQGGPGTATTNAVRDLPDHVRKSSTARRRRRVVGTVIGTIIVATFALRSISTLFPRGGRQVTETFARPAAASPLPNDRPRAAQAEEAGGQGSVRVPVPMGLWPGR